LQRRYFITGGAGFIGSNLTDHLLDLGHRVVGYDNLSTGRGEFMAQALHNGRFRFVEGDVLDPQALRTAMAGADCVFHLAANADIRHGLEAPERDLRQNTQATFNVLEAMRATGTSEIVFASSGVVYGEPRQFPTREDAPFPIQTSLYGASKLAGEGLISAYCEGFGFKGIIFRFVSVVGERYSHGHVFDFYRKLKDNPDEIEVLGDGTQKKSYLYVRDCIAAIELAMSRANGRFNIFNLGNLDYCSVDESLSVICAHMGLSPHRTYTGGSRGWVGDSPFVFLDTSRIQSLGWQPKVSIEEGVLRTVRYLEANEWLFEAHGEG